MFEPRLRRYRATSRLSRVFLVTVLLAALPWTAAAQDIGDAAAGQRLADRWCSSCHAVEASPQHPADTAAPPFAMIARSSATTPLALATFLQTPHSQMPDLQLSRNEIDDLTAYILSLRRR